MGKYDIRIGFEDDTLTEPLDYDKDAHGLLCAPTRAGKFRDVLAQILMTFEGSCFVVDPKGQAAAVTARYRQEVLGQDVCVLNPFNILPDYLKGIRHATYDPISSKLDPASPSFAADADNLMEGLMPHGGKDTHWVDSARILGSGIAMWMTVRYQPPSLKALHGIISGRGSDSDAAKCPECGTAKKKECPICGAAYAPRQRDVFSFCEQAVNDIKSGFEMDEEQILASDFITERLARFTGTGRDNKEVLSIVSTAITQLAFMGNKPIAENLSSSTVDFREMRKRPMTVYLILPGRYMASSAKWFRLITNSWADACLHEGRGEIPILGILDEFKTAVGRLGSIETLLALGAGYGTRLVTVIQDLPSLKELYPDSWETFLSASA